MDRRVEDVVAKPEHRPAQNFRLVVHVLLFLPLRSVRIVRDLRSVNVNQGLCARKHGVDRLRLRLHNCGNSGFVGPARRKNQVAHDSVFRENLVNQFKAGILLRVRVKPADDIFFSNLRGVHFVERDRQFSRLCRNAPAVQHLKNQVFALVEQVEILSHGVRSDLHRVFQGFQRKQNLSVGQLVLLFRNGLFMLLRVQNVHENHRGHAVQLELCVDRFANRVFLPIVAVTERGHGLRVTLAHDRVVHGSAHGMRGCRAYNKGKAGIRRYRGRNGRVNLPRRYAMKILCHWLNLPVSAHCRNNVAVILVCEIAGRFHLHGKRGVLLHGDNQLFHKGVILHHVRQIGNSLEGIKADSDGKCDVKQGNRTSGDGIYITDKKICVFKIAKHEKAG